MHLTHSEIQTRLPLYKALLEAKPEMPVVEKEATAVIETRGGGRYAYSYADLADMETAIEPVLTRNGLLVDFEKHTDKDGKDWLYGMLIHVDSGAYKTSEWEITGRTNQDRGGDITYGRRYLTGLLTGVITDKDVDGKRTTPDIPAPTPGQTTPTKRPKGAATPEQLRELDDMARAGKLPNIQQILKRAATPQDITRAEATQILKAAAADDAQE